MSRCSLHASTPRAARGFAFGMTLYGARCLATAIACIALTAPAAYAQAQPGAKTYAIPPGALIDALTRFAQESGVMLSYSAADLAGQHSPGLTGTFSALAGLNAILAGTSLAAIAQPNGGYVIRPTPAAGPADVTTLSAVTVTTDGAAAGSTEHTGSYTIDSMNTATRMDLSVRETPQSVTVVTRQQMDDASLNSLDAALKQTSGVVARPVYGAYTYTVRGLSVENYQVDGIADSFKPSQRGQFTRSNLDTYIYDHIEVVRGATGLLSPTGDPSATINLVHKRPGKTFDANAGLALGSWSRRRVQADVSTPITADGRVRGRIVAVQDQRDSWRDFDNRHQVTVAGMIEADLTANTLLTVGYDRQRDRTGGVNNSFTPLFYTDGTRFDLPRERYPSADWAYWKNDYGNAYAYLEHKFDNGWKIKGAYSNLRTRTDAIIGFPYQSLPNGIVNRDGSGLVLDAVGINLDSRQDNLDVFATGPFALLGREHRLLLGVNAWKNIGRVHTMSRDSAAVATPIPDIFTWAGSDVSPNIRRTGAYANIHTSQVGLYGNARFSLADTLHLIVGARVTDYHAYRDEFGTSGAYTGTNSRMEVRRQVTPYAGLTYDITPAMTAYASYTDIFRPQTYRDKDNELLDPVVGGSAELGLKTELLDGRLNMSAAVFQADQDNVAEVDDSVPVNSLPDGSQAYRSTGKGNKTRGFELEIGGELARGWQLYAGYSYSRTHDGQGETITTNLPKGIFKLSTSYRLPGEWNKLTIGGNVQWRSRTYDTVAVSSLGRQFHWEQKSLAVVGLHAHYQFNRQWSASLAVENLFDKKYYDYISIYGGDYGSPRSVLLTMRYQY